VDEQTQSKPSSPKKQANQIELGLTRIETLVKQTLQSIFVGSPQSKTEKRSGGGWGGGGGGGEQLEARIKAPSQQEV